MQANRVVTRPGFIAMLLACVLTTLSLACLTDDRDTTGPSPSAITQEEIDGIRLTYICGNTFRVRNQAAEAVPVTWDVYNTSETGALTLPPKAVGQPYSETFFSTVNKGTVRLFHLGRLIQTKANGNKPACATPADTSRPPVPESFDFPANPSATVVNPADPPGIVYYRDLAVIRFDDSTSGVGVRGLLQRYGATVVGGYPLSGAYVIRFPDPGSSWQALDSVMSSLDAEAGVEYASEITFQSVVRIKARYPADGAGLRGTDWANPSPGGATRALLAVRAPLAWGCEAGVYEGAPPRVGVLDLQFETQNPELAANSPVLVQPKPQDLMIGSPLPADFLDHGTAVAGVLTAAGDNGLDAAGMMWRSRLYLFALARQGQSARDPSILASQVLFPLAATSGVRVLVSSVDFGHATPRSVRMLRLALRRYLNHDRGNLFVLAAGQDAAPRRGPIAAEILGAGSRSFGMDRAFAQLFAGPERARMIIVSASDNADQLAFFSDHYPDATELVAPGVDVLTLRTGGGTQADTGTSFATPMVGGAAGLLLAMEPDLRGEEIKDYLVRGAAGSRADPATGALVPPPWIGVPAGRLLDVYGSLRLLAQERTGIPLCGNRMWRLGDTVFAERLSGPERLMVVPSAAPQVATYHGGRLLDVGTENLLQLVGGAWRFEDFETAPAPVRSISGSWGSGLGFSHDRDTILVARQVALEPNPVAEFDLVDVATNQVLGTIATLSGFPDLPSVAPTGRVALLTISPRTTNADDVGDRSVYKLALPGGPAAHFFTVSRPAFEPRLTISEDGAEVAVSYRTGTPPSFVPATCVTEFRSMATAALTRPEITYIDPDGVCVGPAVGIAPLRAALTQSREVARAMVGLRQRALVDRALPDKGESKPARR